MTIDEQVDWYDALTDLRLRLEDRLIEDPWCDHILDLQDELWWSTPWLQERTQQRAYDVNAD